MKSFYIEFRKEGKVREKDLVGSENYFILEKKEDRKYCFWTLSTSYIRKDILKAQKNYGNYS